MDNLFYKKQINEEKSIKNKNKSTNINEYSLKENNFNPLKGSPNFFMNKLEMRMKNYYLELELENDDFSLYHK